MSELRCVRWLDAVSALRTFRLQSEDGSTRVSRQPRDRRRSNATTRLTPRDQALLSGLCRFRIARTSDLLAYSFRGIRRDTAARRLRRLFDGGYVAVRAESRSDENLYHLGPKGKAWAERAGTTVGAPPRGDVAHHLAIVGAWIEIALLVHTDPALQLEVVRPDWEIREARAAGVGLVPDLMVRFRRSASADESIVIRWAVEMDLGTEPLSVLTRKFQKYECLLGSREGLFGWRDFWLVVVTPGQGSMRRSHIAGLLAAHWTGQSAVLGDDRELRSIVSQCAQASPYDLPLRKGSDEIANSDIASASLRERRVL